MKSLLLRISLAVAMGLAAPEVEVALKCRTPPAEGRAASEACVWARSYLPLTRPVYFVLFGLLTFGALTLYTRLARHDP
ncbi:MAG TPA: hypothetical protein VF584_22855 [Longimicrobium sp.]|jgi:hypothetical protein